MPTNVSRNARTKRMMRNRGMSLDDDLCYQEATGNAKTMSHAILECEAVNNVLTLDLNNPSSSSAYDEDDLAQEDYNEDSDLDKERNLNLGQRSDRQRRHQYRRGYTSVGAQEDEEAMEMSAKEQELLVNIQEVQRQLSMVQVQTEKSQEEMLPPLQDSRRRLIMVSNRLPISFSKDENTGEWTFSMSSGGLVTALNGIRDKVPFIWIGWLGEEVAQEDQSQVREKLAKEFNCLPVFLSKEIAARYYNDFSNDILWPIFHYVPLPMFRPGAEKKFDFRPWDAYKLANKLFAQAVNQVYRDGDFVWVHDYHLMMLPSLLRKRHPDATIAWFLHTPFPASDVYRMLPVGQPILEGLLGADLLGFHTYDYARHFLSACSRIPDTCSTPKGIELRDHFSAVGVYPIGIDPGHFENILNDEKTQKRITELCEKFSDKKIIIGVDRMDYIKGIPHRMLSMERFLSMYPKYRENVVLIQVAVPSRTSVLEYQTLTANVNEMVGRINGRFGTLEHSPIHYINRSVRPYELVALYNVADVCLVTSLRDGMNLVSHEYVMCQVRSCPKRREGPGVLVLSEFAGSAQSLSGAIRINPWNTNDIATALDSALNLMPKDREHRHKNLLRYVKTHSASFWGTSFLTDLEYMVSRPLPSKKLFKLPFMDVIQSYTTSRKRLIILNYESTLMGELAPKKRTAVTPPKPIGKRILDALCTDPQNVVLVISVLEKGILSSWLKDPRVGVVAEAGYYFRFPGEDEWQTVNDEIDPSWKKVVRPLMQYFTERTPGSCIEIKDSAMTWHYGETDSIFGPMQARDMLLNLEDVLCNLPLEVVQATNRVIVRLQGIQKTVVIEELLKRHIQEASPNSDPIDFLLCIGNDADDEDLFDHFQEYHDAITSFQQENAVASALVNHKSTSNLLAHKTMARTGSGTFMAKSKKLHALSPAKNVSPIARTSITVLDPPRSAFSSEASIYTCHVGVSKKSKAMYYFEKPADIMLLLRSLAGRSREEANAP